ncbi:uncharacterized protein LOC114077192 [Solanum pennellii]|uniref:Uncharacterized protein LOC114077192 n=1 Tax=Solanum pennellii TaxID=28526 RepID=A0ABM1VAA5_SOLPN|nr:uncharacterized protein LOC114077192 [Solanum pennellii]
MNSQNREKQKLRHRMGPMNFARVRVALRAAKDNNEEPSKPEIFIATRTKTGKEIQADNQVAIAEFENRQNFGETAGGAFSAVFGKEQPGRVRCYGSSVTTSYLKKDEEINNLKQKHADEITSLKEELREEMRHLFTQLLQNSPGLNFQDIPGCVGSNLSSPIDASSAQAVRGTNLPFSSGSAQDSVLQKAKNGVVGATDTEKAELASYHLKDVAQTWCKMWQDRRALGGVPVIWELYATSLVSNCTDEMSRFLVGITKDLEEKCRSAMLHNNMDLSKSMVQVQNNVGLRKQRRFKKGQQSSRNSNFKRSTTPIGRRPEPKKGNGVPVVKEFQEVLPADLPRVAPLREIHFDIDIDPDTKQISIPLY